MLKLKQLSMRNFLSYGNVPVVIDIDTNQSTFIIGDNRDVGSIGNSRNGAGKTSAMQGIVYALYGRGIDKLKSDEFINLINEKLMVVELIFEIAGSTYKIVRGRKPNIVELYAADDNGDFTKSLTLDSMKNTDDLIEKIIRVPYDIFMGVFFMSPHKESFMSMSAAEQRNFIENILSLDVLATRAEAIKQIRKDAQVDIKIAERDLANVVEANVNVEQQISRLQDKVDSFEISRNQAIELSKKELAGLQKINFDAMSCIYEEQKQFSVRKNDIEVAKRYGQNQIELAEMAISSLNGEKNEILRVMKNIESEEIARQTELQEAKVVLESIEVECGTIEHVCEQIEKHETLGLSLADLNHEKYTLTVNIDSRKRNINSNTDEADKLVDEINSLRSGVCPYCSQSHFDEEKATALEKRVEEILDKVAILVEELNEYTSKYDKVCESIKKVNEEIAELPPLASLKRCVSDIERSIDSYDRAVAACDKPSLYAPMFKELLQNYQAADYEEFIAKVDEKIKGHKCVIADCEDAIADLNAELVNINNAIESGMSVLRQNGITSPQQLETMASRVRMLESEIERQQNAENVYVDELKHMKTMIVDEVALRERVDYLNKREKHTTYMIKLLTDSKSFIRKNIVDQYVPYLNKKINEYAVALGLTHVTEINSDLSVELNYMLRSVSYFNMSQGERLRLNIAVTSAFRDLMAMMGKDCNLMCIDEIFDSALDAEGVTKAFFFVKKCAENVWLVSHKDDLLPHVDRVMTVTKQDGFSSITIT